MEQPTKKQNKMVDDLRDPYMLGKDVFGLILSLFGMTPELWRLRAVSTKWKESVENILKRYALEELSVARAGQKTKLFEEMPSKSHNVSISATIVGLDFQADRGAQALKLHEAEEAGKLRWRTKLEELESEVEKYKDVDGKLQKAWNQKVRDAYAAQFETDVQNSNAPLDLDISPYAVPETSMEFEERYQSDPLNPREILGRAEWSLNDHEMQYSSYFEYCGCADSFGCYCTPWQLSRPKEFKPDEWKSISDGVNALTSDWWIVNDGSIRITHVKSMLIEMLSLALLADSASSLEIDEYNENRHDGNVSLQIFLRNQNWNYCVLLQRDTYYQY